MSYEVIDRGTGDPRSPQQGVGQLLRRQQRDDRGPRESVYRGQRLRQQDPIHFSLRLPVHAVEFVVFKLNGRGNDAHPTEKLALGGNPARI